MTPWQFCIVLTLMHIGHVQAKLLRDILEWTIEDLFFGLYNQLITYTCTNV